MTRTRWQMCCAPAKAWSRQIIRKTRISSCSIPARCARRRGKRGSPTWAGSGRPPVDISFPEIEKFDHLPQPVLSDAEGAQTAAGSAFVAIMEGCSKYCSFCVVPYTRGEEISRPFADVLRDVQTLAGQGVREVTLLGQNVNAW